jgi:hypothetical protein
MNFREEYCSYMGAKERPPTLAEAIATETGVPAETYESGSAELRSPEQASTDPDEVSYAPDERPVEFDDLDLDEATEIAD